MRVNQYLYSLKSVNTFIDVPYVHFIRFSYPRAILDIDIALFRRRVDDDLSRFRIFVVFHAVVWRRIGRLLLGKIQVSVI